MHVQSSAVPSDQSHRSRRSHLFTPPPRWTLLIPVVIAGVLAGLAGMTLSFNQQVGTLHDDHGLAEQVLGALAGNSVRVITLTGRPGASVRLIYDPVRRRGGLLVVRLADPGDDLTYRLWLIQRGVGRPVATFVPAADRATFVPIREDLAGYDAITVAVGPQNGPAMNATPVLHASLAASSQHLRVPRPARPLKME
ncbi:MAG TPA: anti-sigma factor [bacterium]|nr:anti-sigma factor [bacterium]